MKNNEITIKKAKVGKSLWTSVVVVSFVAVSLLVFKNFQEGQSATTAMTKILVMKTDSHATTLTFRQKLSIQEDSASSADWGATMGQENTSSVAATIKSLLVAEADIGRDGTRLMFQHWKHTNDATNKSADKLILQLQNPHPLCGLNCLYRYAIEGPEMFGGYLSPRRIDGRLNLADEVTVHKEGSYSAVVYLESMGYNATLRLPWSLSSISEEQAKLETKEMTRNFPITFVGIEVSLPNLMLPVNVLEDKSVNITLEPCSYFENAGRSNQDKWGHFHWDEDMHGEAKVSAELCKFEHVTREEFQDAVTSFYNETGHNVTVQILGTSRIAHMTNGHIIRYMGLAKADHATISFSFTKPPVQKHVAQTVEKLCGKDDNDNFLVFAISMGIWEVELKPHRTRNVSPIIFAQEMAQQMHKITTTIETGCSHHDYGIVLLGNPGTQLWIDSSNRAWKPTQTRKVIGWNETYPEIIIFTNFGRLAVATPHLMKSNEQFHQIAQEKGYGYAPLDLLYLPDLNQDSDHSHHQSVRYSRPGAQMILKAVMQQMKVAQQSISTRTTHKS